MVSIGGIMSLFGLTWLFAVFTFLPINELKKMFDSFFVIFNSFQGLFIFFSYIVLNKEIRESWKELLLCGRYQSKHPPPHSQPKTTPKLRNSGSSGSTLPTGVKGTSEPSKSDLDTMMHKTAESESDVIKNPPPLESISLDPDLEAIELDKLSIKTAMSTEATVTMEETNEAKEPHETAMSIKATVTMEETNETKESHEEITISDESKYEDEDMLSKMCIKQYTTQREFKHQVEQVEVDFYDDDSDKEESTKQI